MQCCCYIHTSIHLVDILHTYDLTTSLYITYYLNELKKKKKKSTHMTKQVDRRPESGSSRFRAPSPRLCVVRHPRSWFQLLGGGRK